MKHFFATCLVALLLWALDGSLLADVVDFTRDIRPILADNCYTCHGPDDKTREADLRLDIKEQAFGKITPGNPSASKLIQRLTTTDQADLMPPPESGKKLTPRQIDLLTQWVQQGAKWSAHWSFVKPSRPPLPTIKDTAWPKTPIDHFILSRLESENVSPSPEADRLTLLRRVCFDLTGLPPTPAQVQFFLSDTSPDAYERFVDRLLSSPHYGERMAQDWLDQARYADTNGYHIDNHRDLWPWRDWVINAYNANKPFDQFAIEQIAGDLLPNATTDQKVATGFNRNEMVNFEGGAIEEEYATKYVVGRVNTTAAVFLGVTMNCAECHDHKYDPFTQKEYYQFYAFFNNIAEKGLDGRNESPAPRLKLPTLEQSAKLDQIQKQLDKLDQKKKAAETELAASQSKWEDQVRSGSVKPLDPPNLLAQYKLDDGQFAQITDSSGNALHGILKQQPFPGKVGYALRLDGRGSHVDLGNTGNFDRNQSFSLGGWVYLENKDGAIITKMQGPPTLRGFDLTIIDQRPFFHLISTWPSNALRVIGKSQLPLKTWLHVFATCDGSGKAAGVKLYVNGILQDVDREPNNLTESTRSSAPLRLGRREDGFFFNGLLDDIRIYTAALTQDQVLELLAESALKIATFPPDKRTDEQKKELAAYYRQRHGSSLKQIDSEIARVRKDQEDLDKTITVTMVMEERKEPRQTHILLRGDYRNKGDVVTADVPKSLPPLPKGTKPDRLALAKWLVNPENPLVARVTINRHWQRCFGTGLVKTTEDFGSRGELPTHPQLLDWLATEFIGTGWDVKAMQRLIVTSATYRQASQFRKDVQSRDPDNRLLARGPRVRLSAEEIRDNALAVGGLLNAKIGGPSVYPYQPAGLWEAGAFGGGFSSQTYVQSHGPDLYRRGLYTYWKRSMPYASYTAFDAPNREVCTLQRPRTNTPLQALVLLNDPVYVEAARAFAQRIIKETPGDPTQRATHAFRLCLSRDPRSAELQVLLKVYQQQSETFRKDPASALKLLTIGESPRDPALDPAELAAWTAVANVLLNLDETITKG